MASSFSTLRIASAVLVTALAFAFPGGAQTVPTVSQNLIPSVANFAALPACTLAIDGDSRWTEDDFAIYRCKGSSTTWERSSGDPSAAVLSAANEAALPSLAVVDDGQVAWTLDENRNFRWNGTAWVQQYAGAFLTDVILLGDPTAGILPAVGLDWDGLLLDVGGDLDLSGALDVGGGMDLTGALDLTGDITLTASDPSIFFDSLVTDFWVGVQDPADVFQIGKGSTPGTDAFLTIDNAGDLSFAGDGDFAGEVNSLKSMSVVGSTTSFLVALLLENDQNVSFVLQNNTSSFAWRLETGGGSGQLLVFQETSDGPAEFTLTQDGDLTVGGFLAGNRLVIDIITGIGTLEAKGSLGGQIKLRDTDDAGNTCCTALNGTLSCAIC